MIDSLEKTVLSVAQLTQLLKTTLESSFYGLTLQGEISNFKNPGSGHWYFQLNDESAAIQAVMFKNKLWRVQFTPKDGDVVIVTGSITIYEKRGSYQIVCETMKVAGTGDILALLEERKRTYARLGYFDESRKRPLPADIRRVAVVTSPTGAAVRDIIQVMGRRDDTVHITVLPSAVQGEGAGKSIAAQIRAANRFNLADVIIVGRGGGSLEDLLPFSEPCVIEAIHDSTIPVVSAVGHEIDWALSDFVADLRAPTPSAAAELVTSDKASRLERIRVLKKNMADAMHANVRLARSLVERFSIPVMSDYFMRRLQTMRMTLDYSRSAMAEGMQDTLKRERHRLALIRRELAGLSPLAVLARGYSITTLMDSTTIVTDANMAPSGSRIGITLATGRLQAVVTATETQYEEDPCHTKPM
jgi:exodeoxyribonuclease VII large subunit